VVGRHELTSHSAAEITEALLRRPEGRFVQALLDVGPGYQELLGHYVDLMRAHEALGQQHELLRQQHENFKKHHEECEADRAARLDALLRMDGFYKELS